MTTVFLDTNVFLDMILKRTIGFQDAEEIFILTQSGNLQIISSASCLLTVIYFLSKAGLSKDAISAIIIQLLKVTSLISTDEKTFSIAVQSDFADLEDAVQYYTALDADKIEYFITSNIKDYKKAVLQLPVVTPKQFITLFNKK